MLAEIKNHQADVAALCQRAGVKRLELFGSTARGNSDASSDLDFMVEFNDRGWEGSSDRFFDLLHGLEDLFKRPVDLVERSAVQNRLFLEVADKHLDVLYAA